MPQKIIIDCDPGQDDAIALMMALAFPEKLELLAVTAVAGNVPLELTQKNARRVVECCGRTDLPIYAGCPRPVLHDLITAEHVHGETGLNGSGLPEPTMPLQPGHAVSRILEILEEHEDATVTLCPTGPLTNIALAVIMAPQIMKKAKEIVLMGGSAGRGNVTPCAEFNFYVDPHAADIVMSSGIPVTMFGLDVTHEVCINEGIINEIGSIQKPQAQAAFGLLRHYLKLDLVAVEQGSGALHDPCVIAHLLDPTIFTGRMAKVRVETGSQHAAGRSIVDYKPSHPELAQTLVMLNARADAFFDLLLSALRTYED